ncbi:MULTISPECIES: hypothetical protein [unclassified Haloferax]|jgi:hypothetical protein|uniref:hypothetical protein n=1 Tax=unclassified Haloferax TaxID=2625095 RepID=UPI0028769DEA|nr:MULTISPECIES: hypothetical protein [unclassified Haloferax]MDS0243135.1 hypothetical protein [Haloferax sp. S2CR25]MDS0446256.1 hypothetical protein [Haloferax sp. S2CR25-2]
MEEDTHPPGGVRNYSVKEGEGSSGLDPSMNPGNAGIQAVAALTLMIDSLPTT